MERSQVLGAVVVVIAGLVFPFPSALAGRAPSPGGSWLVGVGPS